MGLFNAIVSTATPASSTEKLDKGPRPWSVFETLTTMGKSDEEARAEAFKAFLRVSELTPETLGAFFNAACAYAKTHQKTVMSKSGAPVDIIDGWQGMRRPMAAIKAMLVYGKPATDPDGLMLHVADLVHGSSAEYYKAFFAAFADAQARAAEPAGTIVKPSKAAKADKAE